MTNILEKAAKQKTVSVIGLGRLGIPICLVFASFGYKVIAFDIDEKKIHLLNQGKIDLYEVGVDHFLKQYKGNLVFTTNFKEAIKNSNITFIVVPTPSLKDGSFSVGCILDVCQEIGKIIKQKKNRHLIVITSTVSPTSIEKRIIPYLEKITMKRVGIDFGLCYSPEFIALGSVIKNLTYPDFIIIGESDKKSGEMLSCIRKSICFNNPPVVRTNFINAELIKIAFNCYSTTKISFANMIARICEKNPGADTDTITSTLGLTSIIGNRCFTGAIGYGGPCLPRDNLAFNHFIKSLSLSINLPSIIDKLNKTQAIFLKNTIYKHVNKKSIVGFLGLSYKPDTSAVDESPAILLIKELINDGFSIIAYDPAAINNAKLILGEKVRFAHSTLDCIRQSDIIVIIVPWPEFKNIKISDLQRHGNPRVVIDCWRILKYRGEVNVKYIALGRYITQ